LVRAADAKRRRRRGAIALPARAAPGPVSSGMSLWWVAPLAVAVVGSALLAATATETARQARQARDTMRTATTNLQSQLGQVRASVDLARSRAANFRPLTGPTRQGPSIDRR